MPKKKLNKNLQPAQPDEKFNSAEFDKRVDEVCKRVADMLKAKNRSYGNSVLNPVRLFSKASVMEQILVRIDDKLSRIKRGSEFKNEDTIFDLIGYLVFIILARQ